MQLYGNNIWENSDPRLLANAMGTQGIAVTDFDYPQRKKTNMSKREGRN
jgi:hypothetical protein